MATILRGLLLTLALVMCAWFVLGARQAHDVARATPLATGVAPLPRAQAQRARALLRSAGTLNPDLGVDLLRGELALRQHDDAGAERILRAVTRREPENLAAWIQLAFAAARHGDWQTSRSAVAVIPELLPKVR